MGEREYRAVELDGIGEESRLALWDMACGLLALLEEEPDARRLPARGESGWLHELAARHASGEVASAEVVDLVELHYLDERDDARLAEARMDLLVARIVLAIDVIASLMVIPFVVFMSSIDEVLVTVIIDLTSFAMLFDLIRAGTKLRRLAGEGA